MIKLSAVKVRLQYRTRVRYRLLVLEYAWAQGPVAAGRHYGLSARTIRRWRKRWRQGGLEALVPSYPRHRARRVSPPAVELIDPPRPPGARLRSGARPALAAARARDPARDGYDSAGLSRRGPAPPPADPQAGTDRRPLGVSVHRPRRLHALPRPAALSAFGPSLEPRLPGLRRAFPFPIKRLQCDHGQEFSFAFGLGVEAAGIRHRYIRPRRPQQNGKVERSHRIDQEEFWGRQRLPDFEPQLPFGTGRPDTTMRASPWLFRAAHRLKNLPRSNHHGESPRRRMPARARHPNPGVNLDETQQPRPPPLTSRRAGHKV